ncbi:peptidylprolyl isomerase [Peribacillus kribbensis]|uniref:peptidylprolyl isomerase n=1 Tax=Peribacillus kribbensis TaxID=356658 RepID=UPI0003FB9F4E|nr:peptidylprolyl isomerase [Peribacillus kribbensis]
MNKMTRAGRAIILTMVIGGVAAVGAGCSSDKDKAASVNGDNITKQELYDKLYKQNGAAMLNSLITEKMVKMEADKKNVKVSSKEVDAELKKLEAQYGGEDALKSQLANSGLTADDLKGDLKVNLEIKKLMAPDIKVTDQEMKDYFNQNKDSFAQAEQVKASHILVKDKKTADEVKKKLDEGGSFEELAKKYSTDTTKDKGGDLGYFSKGKMTKAFEDKAFSLKKGEISDPVKTEYGYHIIKVVDHKAAKPAVFEDHKEAIKQAVIDQKVQSTYDSWLEKTKKKYKIKNYLDNKGNA